jgi:hypothetical protein
MTAGGRPWRREGVVIGYHAKFVHRRHRHAAGRWQPEGRGNSHFPGGRGTGEGHRPWDWMPNSTMTNATVAHMVKSVEGEEINLQYKDGEKKIVVTPNTTIVTYVPGDKSEVKPGAKIFIAAASKKEDGTLEAPTISVGRDGITPPM